MNSSVILDEKLFTAQGASSWRGDSTQGAYTANRTGTGAWNETRAYTYDSRGHVTSESFAPSATSTAALTYVFDGNNAGGLGQRTSATLSGSLSGNETSSYGADAQLGSFTTAGTMTGPLGTPVNQSFDGMGQLATHNPSTNADTLTWDALGRLISVQRTSGSGFTWSAVYDGLGRRLQTTNQPSSGGTGLVIQQSYDPDVQFLELAVTVVGGARDWLVHGPDINGSYGGLQGTGGIEAVFNGTAGTTTGIVSDIYGHTEATVTGGSVNWNLVRSSGYGSQPGTSASPIDGTHDLATVLAWRGHYIDPTGFYYLGTRYYDPQSGVFVSCDPLGHSATMDLYSAFAGDPINSFDPDGRASTSVSNWQQSEDQRLNDLAENSDAALLGDESNPQDAEFLEQMVTTPVISVLNSLVAFTKNDTDLTPDSLNDAENGIVYGVGYVTPFGQIARGIDGVDGSSYYNPLGNDVQTDTSTQGWENIGIGTFTLGLSIAIPEALDAGAPATVPESTLVSDSTSVTWNPVNGPGPLSADVAATFRSSTYTQTVLTEDTTLYRVYGGNAGPLGSYWTRTPPSGPLQSTIDSALDPAWGNTAENVNTIVVPKGTTIYEGTAAPQGGLVGGGNQVYVPKVDPNWQVPTPPPAPASVPVPSTTPASTPASSSGG